MGSVALTKPCQDEIRNQNGYSQLSLCPNIEVSQSQGPHDYYKINFVISKSPMSLMTSTIILVPVQYTPFFISTSFFYF